VGGCHVKRKENIYYECVSLALVTQHAVSMRRVVLSYVAYLVLSFCSHYHLNDNRIIEQVNSFNYLGNMISYDK
jgi:hypothetical protein